MSRPNTKPVERNDKDYDDDDDDVECFQMLKLVFVLLFGCRFTLQFELTKETCCWSWWSSSPPPLPPPLSARLKIMDSNVGLLGPNGQEVGLFVCSPPEAPTLGANCTELGLSGWTLGPKCGLVAQLALSLCVRRRLFSFGWSKIGPGEPNLYNFNRQHDRFSHTHTHTGEFQFPARAALLQMATQF